MAETQSCWLLHSTNSLPAYRAVDVCVGPGREGGIGYLIVGSKDKSTKKISKLFAVL